MEEVDHEDVKSKRFSQSLAGEARIWFTSLPDNSIMGYQDFEGAFKNQWAEKKDPKKCLSQFHSIRRDESEFVQKFFDRFRKVYNTIPTQVKPPASAAQLQYAEDFDSEFSLWLSERR